jgi:ABC-type transport system involved in multi-copper enzyme maturation permease subunit
MSTRSSFWSVARAVAWRSAHNFFTNPAMIIPALLFPLFFFTAFAGGLSRVDSIPGFDYGSNYTTFVYGFVLLQASTFGGIFTGFAVARDFESGFSRRLMLGAPQRGGIVAGYWLSALLRAIFTVALITCVALVSGMVINGNVLDLVGLYTLALFVNAAAMLFGTGVAMRLRTMQAGPAMQMPAFLVLFLAPVWVPYDLLTGWVHATATVNPTTLVLESGRGFLAGDPTKVLPAFAVAGLIAAITVLWARGGLRSAEQVA